MGTGGRSRAQLPALHALPVPRAARGAEGLSRRRGEPEPAPRKTWCCGGQGAVMDCGRLQWRGREHRWHHVPSLLCPTARGTSGVVSCSAEPRPGERVAVAGECGGCPCLSTWAHCLAAAEVQGFGVQAVCIPAHRGLQTPSHPGCFSLA